MESEVCRSGVEAGAVPFDLLLTGGMGARFFVPARGILEDPLSVRDLEDWEDSILSPATADHVSPFRGNCNLGIQDTYNLCGGFPVSRSEYPPEEIRWMIPEH